MKNITLLLVAIVFTANCYSQTNLVNNGSFETYSNCPTAFSQVDYANGWNKSMTNNPGTSHTELVNSCNTGNWVGVPVNGWGSQTAFEGNGYICEAMMSPTQTQDYRENVYTQLSSPLIAGHSYRISYRVSLSDGCQYASDNICAKFSTTTSFPINNQSHCASGLITDKSNWVQVSATIIADSAYSYLGIGNFYTDANTQYVQSYPSASLAYAVYYIDSIRVVEIPGKDDILEHSGDLVINVSPNPAHDQINISGLAHGTEGVVEMYSVDGRLITSWQVNIHSGNVVTLNLPAECAKGIYFIRFVGEEVSRAEKILIE